MLQAISKCISQNVTAEDFFSYTYAILATPAYVETFSEELTVSSLRLPITKKSEVFTRAAELGRHLIWLHTFAERFVPPGKVFGQIPQGDAQCVRGIPTESSRYPESFAYDADQHTLTVGDGAFRPVSEAVWRFDVSGMQVLHSWLSYRMKVAAGRSSSALDDIRPERWTGDMTKAYWSFSGC